MDGSAVAAESPSQGHGGCCLGDRLGNLSDTRHPVPQPDAHSGRLAGATQGNGGLDGGPLEADGPNEPGRDEAGGWPDDWTGNIVTIWMREESPSDPPHYRCGLP